MFKSFTKNTSIGYLRISALLFSALLSVGCTSMQVGGSGSVPFEEAPLAGMIYSADSRPVRGAYILIDGEVEARSDINGRFVSEPIPPGEHSALISKEGFETQELKVDFSDRLQVLYISLVSFDYLLETAEDKLDGNDLQGASELLQRASKINGEDPVLMMLQLVVAERVGNEAAAVRLRETLTAEYPGFFNPAVRQKR